jgi:hypothetical protein
MYVNTHTCLRTSSSLMIMASSSWSKVSEVMPRRSDEKGPAQEHPPVCVCVCVCVCVYVCVCVCVSTCM